VAVWSAAAPSELSGAVDEAGHGAFTYFVLGALRGWADGELTGQRDGRIDLDEAQAFVRRAMAAHQLTGQHAQLEGRLDALTWAGEVGPEWTRIPVQAPPAASELPDSPAPMAAGPSEPPPAASAPSAAALPRAPRKSRGPKLQSAGWIIAGSGAVLGLGTAIGARAIEAPSNGQVQALTALNVLGWSAAGLGGGLFLVGSLPARDQAASLAIGGRF